MLKEIVESINEKSGEGSALTNPQRKGLLKIIDPNGQYKLENFKLGNQKGSDIIKKIKADLSASKDDKQFASFNKYVAWDNGDELIVRIGKAHDHKSFNQHGVEIPVSRKEFSELKFRETDV